MTVYFEALFEAITHLSPQYLIRNTVMFVTYICALFLTLILGYSYFFSQNMLAFVFQLALWLWLIVLFANFSESIAKNTGKAEVESLKKPKNEVQAKKINDIHDKNYILTPALSLRDHDIVLVEAGDIIPGNGEVILGVAAVDESSITGVSAPVIRENAFDRNMVTEGSLVLSDWLIVKITSTPGESFLDHMIALVDVAKRQKSPNEISLNILLTSMTLIFLIVTISLFAFSSFSVARAGRGEIINLSMLVALFICLIPTTVSGLLSTISIAGMGRLIQNKVIATSSRAVEAAGDVNIVLLDKTGTITMGNRQAVAFYPAKNVSIEEFAKYATLSSIGDDTPEGKSIIQLAQKYPYSPINSDEGTFIPFSAETGFSGMDMGEKKIFKGVVDKIIGFVKKHQGIVDEDILKKINDIARLGNTPLVVATQEKVLGAIELKDTIKPGIKERLAELRTIGIKSIMITGDNPITTATISNETGVDDFYAEVTPEMKLKLIRQFQENGQVVAMLGDGTNDAPALAQTDVAVVMNTGTFAAKEAANMVDLESNPAKLIEIVKIGKQLMVTRGALTTFSISNDVAIYFAILPITFSLTVPGLSNFNIMHLSTPQSAVLSALIFKSVIIIFLIKLALKGVKYLPLSTEALFLRNISLYGVSGLILPFIGIKIIDMLITFTGVI